MQVPPYRIGPFSFDHQKNQITLSPGTYLIKQSVTFAIAQTTNLDSIHYDGKLLGSYADGQVLNRAIPDDIQTR
jgi:hypothetical protein